MLACCRVSRPFGLANSPVRFIARHWHKEAIRVVWEKPESGWTKLNYDGSVNGKTGMASIGGVFRNHKAEFLLGYAESIRPTTSTLAEFAALQRGLELGLENGWKDIWVEGDAKTIVEMLMEGRKIKCAEVLRHIRDITSILLELNFIVTHVYREGNRAADKFAQLGHLATEPRIWRDVPPDEVLPIFHEDALGTIILRHRRTHQMSTPVHGKTYRHNFKIKQTLQTTSITGCAYRHNGETEDQL